MHSLACQSRTAETVEAGCPPTAPVCLFCGQYLQGDLYSAKIRAGAVERGECNGCCEPLLEGPFLGWKDSGNGTSAIRLNGQDRHPAGKAGVLRHETNCGLGNAQGRSCLTVCFVYLFILMIVYFPYLPQGHALPAEDRQGQARRFAQKASRPGVALHAHTPGSGTVQALPAKDGRLGMAVG